MKVLKLTLLLILVQCSGVIFAGGFQINEHGARAMAMGGAYTAIANDASAIYYNNAAITRLSGLNALVGTTVIIPDASFRGPSPSITETDMKKQVFFPSHAFITYAINPNLAVGLGFNTPFGLGTEWDKDWVGRFSTVKIDLKTFSFNPTVAYKFNNLSIGAGLQYNIGSVTIEKAAGIAASPSSPLLATGVVSLEGSTNSAFGFTAGVTYDVNEALQLGVAYRSEVKYDFTGTATSSEAPAQFMASLPHGCISASLTTPQQLVVGVGYKAAPAVQLSADFQYIGWSSYDTLAVSLDDKTLKALPAQPRDYQNTWIARLGGEYTYSDKLALRAGILYDRNPVKDERVDPSLPDADRIGLSCGFGYKVSSALSVDLSYLYLRFSERTITNSVIVYSPVGDSRMNGTYNSDASLISLSLSYKF